MPQPALEDFIDEVSPGIQGAVRFFWSCGFITVDSGDGSNHAAGMEDALPYDHVFIQVDHPDCLIQDSELVLSLLKETLGNAMGLTVEAMYSPQDMTGLIMIADHDMTFQMRQLQEPVNEEF